MIHAKRGGIYAPLYRYIHTYVFKAGTPLFLELESPSHSLYIRVPKGHTSDAYPQSHFKVCGFMLVVSPDTLLSISHVDKLLSPYHELQL